MGRPSLREVRRAEIVDAFARVLADHGYAGATIARVADEAGVAPGLLHHHCADKQDMLTELLRTLVGRFRERIAVIEAERPDEDPLAVYTDAALALGESADVVAARCWVGVFAEAVRDPNLLRQLRRFLDRETADVEQRSAGDLEASECSAVLAFVIGALVFGALAPRRTAGFAAPSLHRIVAALRD